MRFFFGRMKDNKVCFVNILEILYYSKASYEYSSTLNSSLFQEIPKMNLQRINWSHLQIDESLYN